MKYEYNARCSKLQKKAYLAVVIDNRKGADCKVKILLSRYPNDKIDEIILSHIQK